MNRRKFWFASSATLFCTELSDKGDVRDIAMTRERWGFRWVVTWREKTRWREVAKDMLCVADDYATVFHCLDDISEYRHIHFSGRGRKWRVVVEATHDLPMISAEGDDLLDVAQQILSKIGGI